MAGFVHILKLCVGAESVEDLLDWQRRNPSPYPDGARRHVTRMWPKRADEVLAGGSLFWVIRGVILCRQRILRLDPVEGADGVRRCGIMMAPELIRTAPVPRRPFQGWRYLDAEDAPRDLPAGRVSDSALPEEMALALAAIGLR